MERLPSPKTKEEDLTPVSRKGKLDENDPKRGRKKRNAKREMGRAGHLVLEFLARLER